MMLRRFHFAVYDLPLGVFFISAVIGLLFAYDPSLGIPTLIALGSGVAAYGLISRFAHNNNGWNLVSWSITGITCLLSIYFITQSGHLGYDEKVGVLSRISSLIARTTPNLAFWKPLPNSVATFLEGPFLFVLGYALVEQKKNRRVFLLAAWALIGFALLLTASRGAWLAVLGAGLAWAAIYWKPARYLALATAGGLLLMVLFVLFRRDINAISQIPVINQVLASLFIRPDRLEVWRNSLALISDVPFTGIGPGNQFAMIYSRYELLILVPFLYYAHNLFLEIWLEQGLIGILAWIWLWMAVFISAWVHRGGTMRLRFEGTVAGLLAILIHSLTDAMQAQSLWSWLPFFILLGLNVAYIRQSKPKPHMRLLDALPAAACVAFLMIFVITFWPLPSTLQANIASLQQERADLAPNLKDSERSSMLSQAAISLEKVLQTMPGQRTANQRLGLIYLSTLDLDQAIHHLEMAHQALPNHPGTAKALGLAFAFNGQLDQADPLLRSVNNIVDELNGWGFLFGNRNQKQASDNAYRLSFRFNPNQPELKKYLDSLGH